MARGGKREGSGRKSKIEELDLIEAIDKYYEPYEWAKKLSELIKNKDGKIALQAMRLYADYRFGKPQQYVDLTSNGKEFTGISPVEWVKL